MMKLKLMAALVMGTTLVACGGSSSSGGGTSSSTSSSSSSECNNPFGCDGGGEESQLDITLEAMPFVERFSDNAFTAGANNAPVFFSTGYKPLNTEYPQTFEDGTTLNDPEPFFFYPTAGFWETVEGERTGNLNPTLDYQMYVGDGWFSLSNARFTVGQTLSDLVTADDSIDNNAKSRTSGLLDGDKSWGEFDLTRNYRVSFCLKDSGAVPGGTGGNLEVWVDNNSGGQQLDSIHGAQSMLLREAAPALKPFAGNRMVINVPGTAQFVNNEGQAVGDILDSKDLRVGTENSFFQLRVSSGGYAVISDLVVEYQSDTPVEYQPCAADPNLYVAPPAPTIEGVAFNGLPLDMNFALSRNEFFGGVSPQQVPAGETFVAEGLFLAMPFDRTLPFYVATGSAGRTWTTPENTIRFGNSNWTAGRQLVDNVEVGAIDLSVPYRITMEIEEIPTITHATNGLEVRIDSSSGADKRLINLGASGLAVGTLVINVPGDVTMNGVVLENMAVPEHIGTATSYVHFSCPSNSGETCSNVVRDPETGVVTGGIEMSSIVIDYQGEGPGNGGDDPAATNFTWESLPQATYQSILAGTEGTNISITASDTPYEVNGLVFFNSNAGTLRHRGGDDEEFNFNGSGYSSDVTTPAVGEAAPAQRAYIAVPVQSGVGVEISVTSRNSSGSANEAVRLVFVGSDGNVLQVSPASSNEGSAKTFTLDPEVHGSQNYVKVFYSREGTGSGGQHISGLSRTYLP